MPRLRRTRKEREGFLIREFLSEMGYTLSRPKWSESPDAIVTIAKGKEHKRIGIEHTDYFNDTIAGKQSPLTPIADFWWLVQSSLVRRISHRKHLTGLLATVTFQENLSLPAHSNELACHLAEELVDFAEQHSVSKMQHTRWRKPDFTSFPNLSSLVTTILLSRWNDKAVMASRCSWTCSNINTGHIGLSAPYIESAIEKKNRKALQYNRDGIDELWLLIAAGGDVLSNSAGPFMLHEKLDDPRLKALCRNSPFDRIVFWERIRCWFRWMKPDRPAKQYRNPYID